MELVNASESLLEEFDLPKRRLISSCTCSVCKWSIASEGVHVVGRESPRLRCEVRHTFVAFRTWLFLSSWAWMESLSISCDITIIGQCDPSSGCWYILPSSFYEQYPLKHVQLKRTRTSSNKHVGNKRHSTPWYSLFAVLVPFSKRVLCTYCIGQYRIPRDLESMTAAPSLKSGPSPGARYISLQDDRYSS